MTENPDVAVQWAVKGAFKAIWGMLARELEAHGLHPGQEHLLRQLWLEDGLPIGVLAERIGIEVPTVVRAVTRMEAAGILRREPDPTDRRRALVLLTDRGRELEQVVPQVLADVDRRATARLSDDERAELLRLLDEVWRGARGTECTADS
jgi:MarR family transcriptional regulator, organic hydroperoxide resistance regulator